MNSERRGTANFSRTADKLVLDDLQHAAARPEDIEIFLDVVRQAFGLVADLVTAKAGEALQAEVEDGAGLLVRQTDLALFVHVRSAVGDKADQRAHVLRRP